MAAKKTARKGAAGAAKPRSAKTSPRTESAAQRTSGAGVKSGGAWGAAYRQTAAKSSLFSEAFSRPSAQAENAMQFGASAMKEFFSSGAGEAQKAQDKAFAIGRETVQHFTSTADAATRSLGEVFAAGRDNLEACMECSNLAASMGKVLSNEFLQYANSAFSDNVELSQEMFGCRTINDVFDLHNKLVRTNIDNFFTESMRLSEMLFRFASEAAEPFNGRMANVATRFGGSMAA